MPHIIKSNNHSESRRRPTNAFHVGKQTTVVISIVCMTWFLTPYRIVEQVFIKTNNNCVLFDVRCCVPSALFFVRTPNVTRAHRCMGRPVWFLSHLDISPVCSVISKLFFYVLFPVCYCRSDFRTHDNTTFETVMTVSTDL